MNRNHNKQRYFAAGNSYADEFNNGFSNTAFVLAFSDKADRDRWLKDSKRAIGPICKRDVTKYLNGSIDAPEPFSGDRWVISEYGIPDPDMFDKYPCLIGSVGTDKQYGWAAYAERLYK